MTGSVVQVNGMTVDSMAQDISQFWSTWDNQRAEWKKEKRELRNYLFATDTTTTSNSDLPWKNSTTLPKLTQIRDNLHSNYLSGMFPNDDWLRWEAYSQDDAEKSKAANLEAYMKNKTRESNMRTTVSELLLDYIDYGNAFATVEYEHKTTTVDGEENVVYSGPVMQRIHPVDIVFNPLARKFEQTPTVVRSLMQLGEFVQWGQDNPEAADEAVIQKVLNNRSAGSTSGVQKEDTDKSEGIAVDGFGSYQEYLRSGVVEVLTFQGDYYDGVTQKLHRNRKISIVDRAFVLQDEEIPSWSGRTIFHTGWRLRPENLWAMGPLDNLVGMQYRIDHLENLKADVFDLIAHPVLKIIGDVEDFSWRPGESIHIDDPQLGDVQLLSPDTQALNADFQIKQLEDRMELYSGAPREAMGIRTPGEKTAFEVSQLANAAGRIFQEKLTNFEINLLEPALNAMLETARRNLDTTDVVRVMDDDLGITEFLTITKDDITAKGKLRPIGARHFATQSKMMQELTQLYSTSLGQMLVPHTSVKNLSKTVEDILGLERFDIFTPNIGLMEQAETAQVQQELQSELQVQEQIPVEPQG